MNVAKIFLRDFLKKEFEDWHKKTYVQSLDMYGDTYKNNHVRYRWQGWLAANELKEKNES